jgi:PAS domain S-box-containing protein
MVREPLSFQEEAQLWRERYRVLFGENVAGVSLTTPEGRIVDCNEACARILGFDSKETMLAHCDAWDFYFSRAERESLIDRLRTQGISPVEEVCLRARGGTPIWVTARRTVASYVDGVPELLQGTFVDITAQKKAEARLREILGGESSGATPEGESARISDLPQLSDLSQRIGNILRRVNKSLHPDSLPQIDRAEMQECYVALEQMKILMSELEILRLGPK